jgi:hypothetical protein
MKNVWLFASVLTLAGCTSDDPPCTPGGEGLPPGEPVPGPVPTSPVPPGPGDYADPEAPHGYSRVNGEVCVCDARDAERLGCVAERPPDDERPTESCDPDVSASGYNCGPAPSDKPEPDGWGMCGRFWLCCHRIRCVNGALSTSYNMVICPTQWGQSSTRAGAWAAWKGAVAYQLAKMNKENSLCWIQEASCYDHAHPSGICGNYPN